MVAEVVHGAPYRFRDPARFSLAHGGKDRHPYPVPLKVYDETIRVMKSAVQKAKLGRDEEMQALKRLDSQARRLEVVAEGPSLESFIAVELAASPALDGRSVFGWERDLAGKRICWFLARWQAGEMASQTPPVPPQGVWPREQRRKPADGSKSYWSPGIPWLGRSANRKAPWPLCEVIASLSIIVAGQIQQTLPDKRIGFVGEFSYVPSPLLV